MNFRLNEAIEVLERTPATLDRLLAGLTDGCRAVAGVLEHFAQDIAGSGRTIISGAATLRLRSESGSDNDERLRFV